MLGRPEVGVPAARLAVALEPDNVTNSGWYAKTLAAAGRVEEAAAEARRLLSLTGDPVRVGQAAGVLGRSGALDEVRALLRRMEALPEGAQGRNLASGHIRLGLGDYGGALNAFEAVARTDPRRLVAYGLISPEFDPLRADPRFAAILRQVNLDVARLALPDGGRSR